MTSRPMTNLEPAGGEMSPRLEAGTGPASAFDAELHRLVHLLTPDASPQPKHDPVVDAAVSWLTGMLQKGLTRVYAVNLVNCLDFTRHESLVTRVLERTSDPEVARLLERLLPATAASAKREALAQVLAPVAFEGIDQILERANALGRQRMVTYLAGARFGADLVILLDHDPQHEWLLVTVEKRLRQALTELGAGLTPAKVQQPDLAQGDTLHFLGYKFQLRNSQVHCQRIDMDPAEEEPPALASNVSLEWAFHPLRSMLRYWKTETPRKPRRGRSAGSAAPATDLAAAGAETRPETSDTALPTPPSSSNLLEAVPGLTLAGYYWRRLQSIEVGWRHVPVALYPVLAIFFGWRSPVALLFVALILIGNWRGIRAIWPYARRHWLNVMLATSATAGLVCLFLWISDVYAQLSREVPAPGKPDVYVGRYNASWDKEPVPYGLYVPSHFRKEKGPFPLIVFLHGYGHWTVDEIFFRGLFQSLSARLNNPKYARFGFVVYFAFDPTGLWETGSAEVENAMQALDYVIDRHHIDPDRVYLTGISSGGTGVWNLAQAYPDRWAAVAPVSAFTDPDVSKVRHLPTWIFHGAQDKLARVERPRALVQKLKEAKGDVRYTEFPDRDHGIWQPAYDTHELYDWFAQKTRRTGNRKSR